MGRMTTYATRDFGFLQLSGPDASKFLQGYTTCDLAPVTAGSASIGAICNLKGRMVTSFRVAAHEDSLLLRMHRALVPEIITFLSKYIVFSKAEMHDVSESWHVVGISEGDPAPAATQAITPVTAKDDGLLVTIDDTRAELWTTAPPAAEASADAWALFDIEAGLAWISPETVDEFLPQMFAYDTLGAIDFEKGCYLGQEIVARMHFRGKPKRALYRATSEDPIGVGALLSEGSRSAGQVVGAAPATAANGTEADPGSELLIVAPIDTAGRFDAVGTARNTTVTISWSIPKE